MKRSSSALSSLFTSSLRQSTSSNHVVNPSVGGSSRLPAAEPIGGPCKTYPPDPKRYTLLEIIGRGCSSTVYSALVDTGDGKQEKVACKLCDMDRLGATFTDLMREATAMKAYGGHPNVLPLHCAFVNGNELWFVMPLMAGGSVASVLKRTFPHGLDDESIIATIGREVLKALEYVHAQGGIHRDVKASNILIGSDGSIKLSDFGVAATQERAQSWGKALVGRLSLVGTPSWMAPEVLAQEHEYGARADIWSFGISCIEMARGCAPFARMSPLKVLITTLQEPPPQLEAKEGGRTYSKHMRDVVRQCLQKDPEKRPAAAQLLHHKFFKQQGKDSAYLVKALKIGPGTTRPQTGPGLNQALPPEFSAAAAKKALQGLAEQDRAGAHLGRGVIQGAERKSMESYYGNVADLSGWDFGPATSLQLQQQQSQLSDQPEADSVDQVTLRSMLPSGIAFPLRKTEGAGDDREMSSELTLRVDPALQAKQGPDYQEQQEQQLQEQQLQEQQQHKQPSLELQPDLFSGQEGVRKGRFQVHETGSLHPPPAWPFNLPRHTSNSSVDDRQQMDTNQQSVTSPAKVGTLKDGKEVPQTPSSGQTKLSALLQRTGTGSQASKNTAQQLQQKPEQGLQVPRQPQLQQRQISPFQQQPQHEKMQLKEQDGHAEPQQSNSSERKGRFTLLPGS